MSLLAYIYDLPRMVERRIEEFIDRFKPRWLYVEFSGGKDSAAVLAAAVSCCRDMVVATFLHHAGQTHRDNVVEVYEIARRLGMRVRRYMDARTPRELRARLERDRPWEEAPVLLHVLTTARGMHYWAAMRRYGFPAPLERWGAGKRWCCAEFQHRWFEARPPNGLYEGRPARFVVVGVRRQESRYRARLWEGRVWQVFGESYQREPDVALAPIVDLSSGDVWALLRHYGIYDVVRRVYDEWGHSPNCVLCPLRSIDETRVAVSKLPTRFLENVLRVLREVRPRYKDTTFSARRIDAWISMIEEELARRRGRLDTSLARR